MNICGIIAEYNPFHNGHKFHIEQSRRLGASHIACVMSGSFTQRGGIAIMDKWARAEIAVKNGADLVVELPVRYSLASANTFARAGVLALENLRVNTISFGSECGDIAALKRLASAVLEVQSSPILTHEIKAGKSYPRALQAALLSTHQDTLAPLLLEPNNALAIEYINALRGSHISPVTIVREQAAHDSDFAGETIASASHIRALLADAISAHRYLPENSHDTLLQLEKNGDFPVFQSTIEPMIMYKLKSMTVDDFMLLPDVIEGLENRLFRASKEARTLLEFYSLVKTKRYTLARIRRIVYCAFIGITKKSQNVPLDFLHVLAANNRGFEILKNACSTIPICTNFKTLFSQKKSSLVQDIFATDIFSLAKPSPKKSGEDFTHGIFKL